MFEYMVISDLIRLRMRSVSGLIKEAVRKGQLMQGRPLQGEGLKYYPTFEPLTMTLTLEWEEDGQSHSESVAVEAVEQHLPNLPTSTSYLFVCPVSGYRCRDLYKVGYRWVGRRSFKHIYESQRYSHANQLLRYRPSPYHKNGKAFFLGKPTKYAKRCKRWEEHRAKADALLWHMERKRLRKLEK